MGIIFEKPKEQWTEEELLAYQQFIESAAECVMQYIEEKSSETSEEQPL